MFFLISLGKLIIKISQKLNWGNGSTWPGHIALFFNKNFIEEVVLKNKNLKIIVVAGTNGKTTTVSLLKFLLQKFGYRVFSNSEGANLLNGVASSLIKNADLWGNLKFDYAIFEVDELAFPLLLKKINPFIILILNLFRDQLDRYGEVNAVVLKWYSALKKLPEESFVVLNGDDPQLFFLGKKLSQKIFYFGLAEKFMQLKNIPHDVDFNYCPGCYSLLKYQRLSYAHLGDFYCPKCGLKKEKIIEDFAQIKINYPLQGLYNIYNTNASLVLLNKIFNFDIEKINDFLKKFFPAFGRQEKIEYQGRKIFIFLSKNPAGFNQIIKTIKKLVKNNKNNFLLVLNDRTPDGRDVSWIWDVDFKPLFLMAKDIFVSGDRVYDMALRLKYEINQKKYKKIFFFENLNQAIKESIKKTEIGEKLFILPTYSAMLETRRILLGRKFL